MGMIRPAQRTLTEQVCSYRPVPCRRACLRLASRSSAWSWAWTLAIPTSRSRLLVRCCAVPCLCSELALLPLRDAPATGQRALFRHVVYLSSLQSQSTRQWCLPACSLPESAPSSLTAAAWPPSSHHCRAGAGGGRHPEQQAAGVGQRRGAGGIVPGAPGAAA